MTEKNRKARDAIVRRKMAHYVANTIMILQECERREKCESTRTATARRKRKFRAVNQRPPTADEWERYIWEAMFAWQRCILTNLDDPIEFLKMVVLALQGKLGGKTYDDLLIKALVHARKKLRSRPEEAVRVTPEQFDNALTIVSGRDHRPTLRAALRRLKQLHPQVSIAE
jgi:hypothetical protein